MDIFLVIGVRGAIILDDAMPRKVILACITKQAERTV